MVPRSWAAARIAADSRASQSTPSPRRKDTITGPRQTNATRRTATVAASTAVTEPRASRPARGTGSPSAFAASTAASAPHAAEAPTVNLVTPLGNPPPFPRVSGRFGPSPNANLRPGAAR